MLQKIRANLIIKNIFLNLKENIKLILLRYNKRIQQRININLIDYRRCSGRYIIFEENGRGKEYNSYTDQLLYDGEYLKGKKMEKEKNIIMMVN